MNLKSLQSEVTIVLFHGFLGGPEDWLPVIAHLPCNFNCHAIDLNTAEPLEQAREQTKHFLDKKKGTPCFLMGYSMGGRLAWQLASYFYSSIKGLILLGAHPGLANEEDKKARRESDRMWIDLLQKGDITLFLNEWYAQPLFDTLRKNEFLFSTSCTPNGERPSSFSRYTPIHKSSMAAPSSHFFLRDFCMARRI